jgi:dTDP-4-dehydrorhamnose 3,5-epimerase
MKFIEQKLPDVFLIEPKPIIDDRGSFRRHFCKKEFAENGIISDISQSNVSENKYAFTLRGFHYQLSPHSEGKTLSCLKGSIYDIVVDLRHESQTYMKWVSFELNQKNRNSVHIPPGCSHAFLTLEDNCLIHYYCSEPFSPELERGIRYNDPSFNFEWPAEPKVISSKDMNHPDYNRVYEPYTKG